MKIIPKHGLQATIPNGDIGELLFCTDTNELFVGRGQATPPAKISGTQVYSGTEVPQNQKVNDIFINTSKSPYEFQVYSGSEWIQVNESQTIGDLSSLMTIDKSNIVSSINELYLKLFSEVLSFDVKNIENGQKIKVSWINPTYSEFVSRELYMHASDMSGMNRNECLNVGTLLTSDAGTGRGNSDSMTITSTLTQTYYFKMFVKLQLPGEKIMYSNGLSLNILCEDTTPPDIVTELNAVASQGQIVLKWSDPNTSDWVGTKVVRKIGYYPTNPNDVDNVVSKVVVDSTVKNQYNNATAGFIDTDVENDVLYYYQLFTYDSNGNYNISDQNRITMMTTATIIPEVTNFAGVSQNEGKQIQLSWHNPDDITGHTLHSKILYASKSDISSFTELKCQEMFQNNQGVTLLTNTQAVANDDESYLFNADLNAKNNDVYYFKMFTRYRRTDNVYLKSVGRTLSVKVIDNTQPDKADLILSNCEVYESQMSLKWTDPTNTDWAGTVVAYKQGNDAPVFDPNNKTFDGIAFTSITERNKHLNTYLVIDNLQNDVPYTFKLFPFDLSGNYNTESISLTVTPVKDPKSVQTCTIDNQEENALTVLYSDPTIEQYANWQGTVVVKKLSTNGQDYPQDVNDGEVIIDSTTRNEFQTTPFIDTDVIPGKVYTYRLFTYEMDGENRIYNTRQIRYSFAIPTAEPPLPVTTSKDNFILYKDAILMKWTESTSDDWHQTKVVRDTSAPFLFSYSGTMVNVPVIEKDKYKTKYFVDNSAELAYNQNYYYGIFPCDTKLNYQLEQGTDVEGKINNTKGSFGPFRLLNVSDISNMTGQSLTDGLSYKITFNNVADIENYKFIKRQVFASSEDLTNLRYHECLENVNVFLLDESQGTGQGVEDNAILNSTSPNNTYYFKVFTLIEVTFGDDFKNNIWSDGYTSSFTAQDLDSPNDISNFTLVSGYDDVKLKWTDPDNFDWSKTRILRKKCLNGAESFPSDKDQYNQNTAFENINNIAPVVHKLIDFDENNVQEYSLEDANINLIGSEASLTNSGDDTNFIFDNTQAHYVITPKINLETRSISSIKNIKFIAGVTNYQSAETPPLNINTAIKTLISFDSGITWKKYNIGNSQLETVTTSSSQDINDIKTQIGNADIITTGNTLQEIEENVLNYIPVVEDTGIMFAFDLKSTVTTDTPWISGIEITYFDPNAYKITTDETKTILSINTSVYPEQDFNDIFRINEKIKLDTIDNTEIREIIEVNKSTIKLNSPLNTTYGSPTNIFLKTVELIIEETVKNSYQTNALVDIYTQYNYLYSYRAFICDTFNNWNSNDVEQNKKSIVAFNNGLPEIFNQITYQATNASAENPEILEIPIPSGDGTNYDVTVMKLDTSGSGTDIVTPIMQFVINDQTEIEYYDEVSQTFKPIAIQEDKYKVITDSNDAELKTLTLAHPEMNGDFTSSDFQAGGKYEGKLEVSDLPNSWGSYIFINGQVRVIVSKTATTIVLNEALPSEITTGQPIIFYDLNILVDSVSQADEGTASDSSGLYLNDTKVIYGLDKGELGDGRLYEFEIKVDDLPNGIQDIISLS